MTVSKTNDYSVILKPYAFSCISTIFWKIFSAISGDHDDGLVVFITTFSSSAVTLVHGFVIAAYTIVQSCQIAY